jgi:outer membrane lipoprotein carrier protein
MKISGAILACGITVATAFAVIPANPATALKEVRKHYKEVKTLQASFKESFQWALTGETVERQGKVIVAEGNRFRVETPEQLIISNGAEVYRYNKLRNQVMIESVSKAEDLLPNKVLLKFAAEFEATSLSPLAVEGVEGYRLDLKPQDPDKALLGEASIWVTAADKTVRRILLVDLNNNATTYTLSDIRFDQSVDSSALAFTPPVGAELFDLR